MLEFTPLMSRTAIAKTLGFVAGLIGFFGTRNVAPTADPMLAWAILFLFLTIGGLIGVIGTVRRIPLFEFNFSPLLRGGFMGGWVTLVCVFFGFNMLSDAFKTIAYLPTFMQSPWWFILDGVIVGAVIDVIASRLIKDVPDLYNA